MDMIRMLPKTAEAISHALGQDFNKVETPERMAWVLYLLRRLPDDLFPHGKWATIQGIETQLIECADTQIAPETVGGEE